MDMQNSFNIRITKILDGLNLPNPFEEEIIEEKQEPPIIDLNPINLNDLQNPITGLKYILGFLRLGMCKM